MPCSICGAETEAAFEARVLDRYQATYSRCVRCGFMKTNDPHWLDEAYSSAINEIDIGVVSRATSNSRLIEGLLLSQFDPRARFIDYGAGYGLLVRLMRDRGYDFYWQDRFCENIFAQHFEATHGKQFELLTAFEVFEHLLDPVSEIEEMLSYSSNILFSTLLVPPGLRSAEDWWYFGPDHGQHISFYTTQSLQLVAERFGLHLASYGDSIHLLTKKPVRERMFRFLVTQNARSELALRALRRRRGGPSLLSGDFRQVSRYVP